MRTAAGEGAADPRHRGSEVPSEQGEEKVSKPKGIEGTLQDRLGKLERLSKINTTKLRICLVLHFRRKN